MKIYNLDMEEENMPYKLSMRKSSWIRKDNGYDSWDDYYPRRRYRTLVKRFIEKNVGNNYDEVFSKFIKSLKDKHMSEKDIFYMKDHFEFVFNKWYYPDYKVDDNGNIAKIDYPKKSKDLVLYNENGYYIVYRLKKEYQRYSDRLIQLIGIDEYERICKEYVTWDIIGNNYHGYNLLTEFIKDKEHTYYKPTVESLFDTEIIGNKTVYEYRSPEYYRYIRECVDSNRKQKRESKKAEYLETLLYVVEEKRREKEKAENTVKIVKNGFDPKTSFRNVPAED